MHQRVRVVLYNLLIIQGVYFSLFSSLFPLSLPLDEYELFLLWGNGKKRRPTLHFL